MEMDKLLERFVLLYKNFTCEPYCSSGERKVMNVLRKLTNIALNYLLLQVGKPDGSC